jgi:Flp pilus assembly protein TadD
MLLTFFTFQTCLQNGFTNWDDPEYLLNNPSVQKLSLHNIQQFFGTHLTGKYHPFPLLSFALDYHFFQANPVVYHSHNLLLHLINTALVFLWIYSLLRNEGLALLTALFFGIHPLHVEPIAWVAARKELLFTSFYLLSLLCYMQNRRTSSSRRIRWWYFLSIGCFLCALLSKVMAVSLPLVLLLMDRIDGQRLSKPLLMDKIPYFCLSFIFTLITMGAVHAAQAMPASDMYPIWIRGIFSLYAIILYLGKLCLPLSLSAFYPLPSIDAFIIGMAVIAAVIIGGLAWLIRKERYLCFGYFFFLVTLIPALHLVAINDSIIYDRFVYLPSIGVLLILAYSIQRGWQTWRGSLVTRSLLLIGISAYVGWLGLISSDRCLVWRNSETLWLDVLKKYPDVPLAHHNLAAHYDVLDQRILAMEHFNQAIQLAPTYTEAWYNRGNLLAKMGEYQAAIKDYSESLRINPLFAHSYVNRGNMFFLESDKSQALADYNHALKLDPQHAVAYKNRGMLYFDQKEYAKALKDFEHVLELTGTDPLTAEKIAEIRQKIAQGPSPTLPSTP